MCVSYVRYLSIIALSFNYSSLQMVVICLIKTVPLHLTIDTSRVAVNNEGII